MELNKRLKRIASYVREDAVVADIGTDHGYIPIYLVMEGIVKKAYAMDVNKGPLEKAKENISKYGVIDRVITVLSDGLEKLEDKSVNTVIIAGMGGMLISDLLSKGHIALQHVEHLILSPHLDGSVVRKTIHQLGFLIEAEDLLMDEDKFYPIIVCKKGQESYDSQVDYEYGKLLIESKSPILKEFLENKLCTIEKILDSMGSNDSCHLIERKNELLKEYNTIEGVVKLLC